MEELLIREKVERLTEILFCAETSGPETLGCLRHWFKEIRQWAGRKAQPDIMFLSHAASNVVEKMILDRACAAAAPMSGTSKPFSREKIRNQLLDELIEISESEIPFTTSTSPHDALNTTCVI